MIRINIDGDMVLYDTEQWLNLPEQHMAWTTYLDEQVIFSYYFNPLEADNRAKTTSSEINYYKVIV